MGRRNHILFTGSLQGEERTEDGVRGERRLRRVARGRPRPRGEGPHLRRDGHGGLDPRHTKGVLWRAPSSKRVLGRRVIHWVRGEDLRGRGDCPEGPALVPVSGPLLRLKVSGTSVLLQEPTVPSNKILFYGSLLWGSPWVCSSPLRSKLPRPFLLDFQ